MGDKMRVFERAGIIFASSRAWARSTIDAAIDMARGSSAGLEAIQTLPDGSRRALWNTGMLCSQAPETLDGLPIRHELNNPYPPKPPYYEYINGATWLKRSRSVKRWQGWTCHDCGRRTHMLQAAHKTYDRLGNELPADLMALCDKCHRRRHGMA